jgi:hypothetical protein
MPVNFEMDFAPLGKLGEIYRQNQERQTLQQGLSQMGLPGNMSLAQLALQQQAVQRGEARDTRDFGFRQQESQRAQANADRAAALQREQFTAGLEGAKMQPGFERDPNTGGHRPIKGGVADPDYVRSITEVKDKGRPLSVTDITKLSEEAGKFSTVKTALDTFDDKFAGNTFFGEAKNITARNLPSWATDPTAREGAKWWQEYDRYKNVVRNDLFGSALTAPEQAAFTAADITPNMNPELVRKNLQVQHEVLQGAMKRKAGALVEQGYKPEVIARAYGTKLEELGVEPRTRPGAAPAAPQSPAQPPQAFNWKTRETIMGARQNAQATIAQAKEAVAKGMPPAEAIKRLQAAGIPVDPSMFGGAPAAPQMAPGSGGAIY